MCCPTRWWPVRALSFSSSWAPSHSLTTLSDFWRAIMAATSAVARAPAPPRSCMAVSERVIQRAPVRSVRTRASTMPR